jgi:hypothetical protein
MGHYMGNCTSSKLYWRFILMKKQLKSSTVYQPNAGVKVTVVNKPIIDDTGMAQGYDTDVSIKIKMIGRPLPLNNRGGNE